MAERQHEPETKLEDMTRDDLKKIEKSMKKPEFMGLLNEYMIEISDPKNKNEYDDYLRQMEREKELPKHMKIVEIKAKFCFRTFLVSQKNKKHEMKFFINMCESQYLEKPGCDPVASEDGQPGFNWRVPNSMGKIRYDQDKKGNPCQVVDIAFHPDAYMFAAKKGFQEMMINIALEAAERQLGERKESLSKDYIILKNLKCKGQDGKPALMPIRYISGKVYNKGEGPNNEPERDMDGKETKLMRDLNLQKEEHQKKQKKQRKQKEELEKEEQEEQLQDQPKLVVDMEQGVQRPKYSTIYTYPIDYSEFIDSPYTKRRTVPTVFNIEFAIPRVESTEEVAGQTLEINDKKILLKIGEKYFIDLELEELKIKYVLLTANAKAKYDKKKKSLRIVIPVDQTVKYTPDPVPETKEEEEKEEGKVIEEETWKNKVLDFTEPNVSVKTLETQEVEESKPSLVEEIDEDDFNEQPKTEEAGQEDEIQQEITQPVPKTFSVSNYYSQSRKEFQAGESHRISYLFQETADKIVLVVQMKNYKKEDVKFLSIGNQEFLVIWDQQSKGLTYEHLKLSEAVSGKVEKVEAVFRVGFLAVMINKTTEEKGKFWQKEAVEQVVQGDSGKGELEAFQAYFEEQKQAEESKQKQQKEQKEQKEKQEQEQRQAEKQAQIKQSEKSAVVAEPAEKQQLAELPEVTKKEKALEVAEAVEEVAEGTQGPEIHASLFTNLQPQFIVFDAPFVMVLD